MATFAVASFGQASPTVQQTSEKSTCSNIVALAGNVNLNCSSLTPEQKKTLDRIPLVLNKILSEQIDQKAMSDKLDEILRILAQPIVPRILGFEAIQQGDPDLRLPGNPDNKPLASFKFYTDRKMEDPKFVVSCDNPCVTAAVQPLHPSELVVPSFRAYGFSASANVTLFRIINIPFNANTYYLVTVFSQDSKPVHVLSIAPYLQSMDPL